MTTGRHLAKALGYGLSGGLAVLIVLAILFLNRRTDLSVWHEVKLEGEFTADSRVKTFADYLDLEDALFDELNHKVFETTEPVPTGSHSVNRYRSGSLADSRSGDRDWNRTFELKPDTAPTAGFLLLHGMSDSPYSLRAIGERLHQAGGHVIGLRLPGHGTAPSGLTDFEWEDMDAAVRLAARHLSDSIDGKPLYLIGYSNGGALSVHYALECLDDESLPAPSGIILISPAIGVTPMASLAVWQMRLGHWLGLEKLEWNSILPEYDPYKYVSFAVNAGHQVYRLTTDISDHLDRLAPTGKLDQLPRILAFQSIVDATVSTPALVDGLLGRLPATGHELVIFDINRVVQAESLLTHDPTDSLAHLLSDSSEPFDITVLSNTTTMDSHLRIRSAPAGRPRESDTFTDTELVWPKGIYSLSHVSLPFSPNDPLYGNGESPDARRDYPLGNLALRGERGVLQVSAADQLRLRWNPFYGYLESRILAFVGIGGATPR
ncbi:MAG: alpha/beta fold hydrolase [Verrucomicrobiae bacterium]|nr:alpha/beta fold hydrolase [Verrucomicrobiae bacterium]